MMVSADRPYSVHVLASLQARYCYERSRGHGHIKVRLSLTLITKNIVVG